MPNIGLTDLAASIADGSAIDWERLDRSPDISNRLLTSARVVHRLAQLHAGLPPIDSYSGPLHDSLQQLNEYFDDWVDERQPVTWGPLTILEKIGSGTYGDVFRAHDPRLNRQVALKLLRRRDRREDVVIEEGHLLARIRHPNVVTVYGAERIDGRVGVWMEFVDGLTLEQEVKAQGPLAPHQLRKIAGDLASALSAVHAAGLVHRDVKAQNVMRDAAGRILLMDFGAGCEGSEPGQNTDRQLAGTPVYLAPEVFRGEPATPASDIYSLGVLLFYLATNTFPVPGRSLAELRQRHAIGTKTAVRDLRPDLPRDLAVVIERAAAVDQRKRFSSANHIAELLSERRSTGPIAWTFAGVAAVALLIFGLSMRSKPAPRPPSTPTIVRNTLLVTDLENHADSAACAALAARVLHEALFASGAFAAPSDDQIRDGLQMMKRPVNTAVDRSTGRELALRDEQIKAVVAGTVENVGENCRITTHLVDPVNGTTVTTLTEDLGNPHQVRTESREYASQLQASFDIGLARLKTYRPILQPATTASLRALELYSRSYDLGRQGNWSEAVGVASQAVQEDPTFASAWTWLAWATRNNLPQDIQPTPFTVSRVWFDEQRPKYLSYAQKALDFSDDVPEWERHWIFGSYDTLRDDDGSAIRHYERLLTLKPNHFYGANNLLFEYHKLRRLDDYLRKLKQRADQAPANLLRLWGYVGAAAAITGDTANLKPYLTRMEQLLGTETGGNANIRDLPRVTLDWLPTYTAWTSGDVATVLRRVNTAENELANQSNTLRGRSRAAIAYFNIALGRLREAERLLVAFDHPGGESGNALDEALIAIVHNDPERVRKIVKDLPKRAPLVRALTLSFAGLSDDLRRMLESDVPLTDDYESLWALGRGQLLLQDGHPQEAMPELHRGTAGLKRTAFWEYYGGCELEANALEAIKQLQQSIDLLQACANERPPWYPLFSTPYFWMKLRLHLADNLRLDGQTERAERIENDIRRLLIYADADHPLVIRLRQH